MLGGSLDSIVDPATDRSCDSVSDGFAVEICTHVLYDAAQPSPICRSIQFTTKLTWAVRVTTRGRSRSWSVLVGIRGRCRDAIELSLGEVQLPCRSRDVMVILSHTFRFPVKNRVLRGGQPLCRVVSLFLSCRSLFATSSLVVPVYRQQSFAIRQQFRAVEISLVQPGRRSCPHARISWHFCLILSAYSVVCSS